MVKPKRLEFWESEETKPEVEKPREKTVDELQNLYRSQLSEIKKMPFRPRDRIVENKWKRIVELVTEAYKNVPFYRKLYEGIGFEPGDLKSRDDFSGLPIVHKEQLIEAGLDNTLNKKFDRGDLFYTRSSGSSGTVLRIGVNKDAVLLDTIQGIRQFWLQSDRKYNWNHLATHVYTVPWWFSSIRGRYETAFISSLMEPERIVTLLKDLNPHILSLYPSNLASLLEITEDLSDRLYLAVVHSEMSSKPQKDGFSAKLGIPVSDEYSSEELTRISLELPCGHNHVHEDSVHIEVINDSDLKPVKEGEFGVVVGTNLLNEAMPFIRYKQGDYVKLPRRQAECKNNWYQIEQVEGRSNDGFLRRDGKVIPAGTLLDASYRWMFDSGIQPYRFEMVQLSPDTITVNLEYHGKLEREKIVLLKDKVQTHMKYLLGEDCSTEIHVTDKLPAIKGRKYRPIRRGF